MDDFDYRPFQFLYLYLPCLNCEEDLVVGLTENIKKNGFSCPYCNTVTDADDMWELYLMQRELEKEEDS